jgi:Zn-dependent metalloprotease
MDYYVDTQSDNGGVHINSGIPNHAFYLFCQYIGGKAWKAPGQIWYHALQRLNNPQATFHHWAAQTVDSAITLHGIGSIEVLYLRRAWKLVGVDV